MSYYLSRRYNRSKTLRHYTNYLEYNSCEDNFIIVYTSENTLYITEYSILERNVCMQLVLSKFGMQMFSFDEDCNIDKSTVLIRCGERHYRSTIYGSYDSLHVLKKVF
ncbi:Uncharacterised protein at_DN0450 [Pycnogonum litorale]